MLRSRRFPAATVLAGTIALLLAWGHSSVAARAQSSVPDESPSGDAVTAPRLTPGNLPLPAPVARILEHPSLEGARVGMVARVVPGGEFLLSHQGDALFAPASVNKLFTVAATLWRFGPHFVWETPVAHTGQRRDAVIDGDLWVVGRGAPDLVEEKLWLAARRIGRTIDRVAGDLVVDDRYFDARRFGRGWPGGRQRSEAYHAPIGALMANFAARREGGEWVAVDDPALHFGRVFLELLEANDVAVDGTVRRPTPEERERHPTPADARPDDGYDGLPSRLTGLHLIRSEPLGRIVMDVNKFSNNVMAEVLLKSLGAAAYDPPGTADKGLAVVARFLGQSLELPLNSYVQVDGSGLSRLARFSPGQVVALLDYVYDDFHLGPELVASLKLGGLDGWNPRPFKDPPLRGELRVKSGHIRGVNTLGGYVHADSGEIVAFCIMVNEHRAGQWEIDQRMAEITDAILSRY